MDIHIIKLMVWFAGTLGIYGEVNNEYDHQNIRNQRDIIRGGIYDNDNYATSKIDYDSGSIFADNNIKNNYQAQAQLDNSYNNNEMSSKPRSNYFEHENHEDFKRYANSIYSKNKNNENSFVGRNNEQLHSVYNSYQGDAKTFQDTVINGATKEVNTSPEINAEVGPQSYPGSFNSYIPIPFSRRIIVPVPTAIPEKQPVSQVPEVPYLVQYQPSVRYTGQLDHPSESYTDKLPVVAPISVEAAFPNRYPVASPPAVAVGGQQPILVKVPESYYLNSENKDIVDYNENSWKIRQNSHSTPPNEDVMIYKKPSNYYNGYPGKTQAETNSLTFGKSQKPIHGTFKHTNAYYSYPSPNVSENLKEYGNSQRSLYNGYIQSGRNYNSMNLNKNMGSRYPNLKPHGRFRQGKVFNRNKNIYAFTPPCYIHRRNGYRH